MKYTKLFFIICLVANPIASFASSKGFIGNIDELTMENKNFRQVIYTAKHLQLVLMTLKPGEEIGKEMHQDIDQFFRIEGGSGKVVINGKETSVKKDDAFLIPAESVHNVINTGKEDLHIYTLYGPPGHKDKTIHKTKAGVTKEKFDGKTSE